MERYYTEYEYSPKPRTTWSNKLHLSKHCLSPATPGAACSVPELPLLVPALTYLNDLCFTSDTYALHGAQICTDCSASTIHHHIDSTTTSPFGGQTTLIWSSGKYHTS